MFTVHSVLWICPLCSWRVRNFEQSLSSLCLSLVRLRSGEIIFLVVVLFRILQLSYHTSKYRVIRPTKFWKCCLSIVVENNVDMHCLTGIFDRCFNRTKQLFRRQSYPFYDQLHCQGPRVVLILSPMTFARRVPTCSLCNITWVDAASCRPSWHSLLLLVNFTGGSKPISYILTSLPRQLWMCRVTM